MNLERIKEHLKNVPNGITVSLEDIELMEQDTIISSGAFCDVVM